MKKRTYRAKSVKDIDLDQLGAQLLGFERVVVGIDVAKDVMVGAVTVGGEVHRTLKWHHLEESGDLVSWLSGLSPRVEVAMEPSGTYGDTLRWQLQQAGIEVFRVSPKKVKDCREIYDGVPSTHDGKAAAIISWLHLQGRSEPWSERCESDRALAAAVQTEALYSLPYRQCQNRLEGQLARYWPEATQHLELDSVTLLELLMEFGSPAQAALEASRAKALMRRVGGSLLKEKKIEAVVSSSSTTLGVPMVAGERRALQALAAETRRYQKMSRHAKKQIEKLSEEDPLLGRLGQVVGKVTAAILTVHAGRVNAYRTSGSWEKSLGLNLRECSSGRYRGQPRITKRGPGIARQYLYLAVLRLVKKYPLARAWYEAKVRRDGGRVKKKALVAVMRKLARSLWWVGQGEIFDIDKLFDGRRLDSSTMS